MLIVDPKKEVANGTFVWHLSPHRMCVSVCASILRTAQRRSELKGTIHSLLCTRWICLSACVEYWLRAHAQSYTYSGCVQNISQTQNAHTFTRSEPLTRRIRCATLRAEHSEYSRQSVSRQRDSAPNASFPCIFVSELNRIRNGTSNHSNAHNIVGSPNIEFGKRRIENLLLSRIHVREFEHIDVESWITEVEWSDFGLVLPDDARPVRHSERRRHWPGLQ